MLRMLGEGKREGPGSPRTLWIFQISPGLKKTYMIVLHCMAIPTVCALTCGWTSRLFPVQDYDE